MSELVERLRYRVNNPSAWPEGFDEQASELFREAADRIEALEAKEAAGQCEPTRYFIEHDGFVGTVIGRYKRLDGKAGVVMQQDGTNIVHVYGSKWLKPAGPPPKPI